jgi:hypothetical protein
MMGRRLKPSRRGVGLSLRYFVQGRILQIDFTTRLFITIITTARLDRCARDRGIAVPCRAQPGSKSSMTAIEKDASDGNHGARQGKALSGQELNGRAGRAHSPDD